MTLSPHSRPAIDALEHELAEREALDAGYCADLKQASLAQGQALGIDTDTLNALLCL
jgi:hypothetical protein